MTLQVCVCFSPSYLNIPHSLAGLGLWRYWYLCLKCLPLAASTSFPYYLINTFVVVQSHSRARLSATPWTAACLPSLSFTISLSLLKLMSFESVMPSNHLILCHPLSSDLQSFPASVSFPVSQLLASSGQSIGSSTSASVLPMNTQHWFPLGLIVWISFQSKGLLRAFSNTTVCKHQLFGAQFSLWSNSHIHTWLLEKPSFDYTAFVGKVILCFLICYLGSS